MADRLSLFRLFIRCVDLGSFSAVAREMNGSQPTVSRQVAQLEAHLGCLLFQRTTRSLTLTEDGRRLEAHARRVLEAVEEAEDAVGKRHGRPQGRLHLACSGVFGRLHIIPRLPDFQARYPEIEIALHLGDGFVDLVEQGVDLAIRIGENADSALVARRIGTSRRVVLATPDYLAGRSLPQDPADLAAHDCIVYDRLLTGASWTFQRNGVPVQVPVSGRVHVNATEGVRAAVLAGLGLAYIPDWHFIDGEIASGQLVTMLDAFAPPGQPIHALYPSRRFLPPRVRVAIDFFAEALAAEPSLRIG